MKRIAFLAVMLLFYTTGHTQSIQEIKKQKEKTEKEISYLNKLLKGAEKDKSVSTEKLNILQEKIVQSKKLLGSLNQEVRYFSDNIAWNEKRIGDLETEKKSVLGLYAKLVYNTWKKRNKIDKLMFIFSSADFNQAYHRFKYFQQIREYSGRQLRLIGQLNDSLNTRNQELGRLVKQKNELLGIIALKNRELESEKSREGSYMVALQKKEKDLKRRLQKEMQSREKLAKELNRLITLTAKKAKGSSSVLRLTPEEKLISDDFAKNRGRLPWPVERGFISRKFGLSVSTLHKRVQMNNNGVDITTSKNAEVRAIFKGIVSRIWFSPGLNNVIVVQHGDYFTIYPNLVRVNVSQGSKVSAKDVLGVLYYDNEEGSILNFQIWKMTDRPEPEKLDPQLWLAK